MPNGGFGEPASPEELLTTMSDITPEVMGGAAMYGMAAVGPELMTALVMALQDALFNDCQCAVCTGLKTTLRTMEEKIDEAPPVL